MMKPATSVFPQHGFTLLETMVALLIFSVGLLGLAGMQMAGMQSNHGAMMRTIATQHSYNMAERVRSSRAGFIVEDDASVKSCSLNTCTTVAATDYDSWITAINNSLPSGDGQVSALGGGVFQITVRWDENRTGADGLDCPPKSSQDLQCIQLTIIP